MIKSVTEYFESLYNIKKSNGKLKLQLEQRDRKKYDAQRGSAKNRYDDKLRYMADERRTSSSRDYRDDRNHNRGYKPSCDRDKRGKSERKAPPEFAGKPCRVHGNKAKHTYEECRDNPKNRKPSSGNRDNNNSKKRHHDAHYQHDERYLSSQDESPDDHRTPEPSDDDGSKSSNSGDGEIGEENYHVDTSKVPQKKRKVGVVQKNFRAEKPSHSAKHVTPSLLQDELDKSSTEIEKSGDVTNPFAFK
jgi:hypothetical protein